MSMVNGGMILAGQNRSIRTKAYSCGILLEGTPFCYLTQ
jgi:hypothetical protein